MGCLQGALAKLNGNLCPAHYLNPCNGAKTLKQQLGELSDV